jgi:predicted transcriptional regulator
MRKLDPKKRRALELLAGTPEGTMTQMVLLGHGFTEKLLAELVEAGLARVTDGRDITVVHITDAGRRALAP